MLETQRLFLRQWRESDRAPFAQFNADPRVMEFFPAQLTSTESDALFDRAAGFIDEKGWGFWALEEKATGTFIGFTGLYIPTHPLPFAPCVETGWRLGFEFWGKGYATEAAQASLRFGFGELDLDEIVSFTPLNNLRSQAVMKRLGMQNANEDFDHPAVPENSSLRRHCLYRLSQSQYQALPK